MYNFNIITLYNIFQTSLILNLNFIKSIFFFILVIILFSIAIIIISFYMGKFINKYIIKKFFLNTIQTFLLKNNHNSYVKYINISYNYVINHYKDDLFIIMNILLINNISFLIFLVIIDNINLKEFFKFCIKNFIFTIINSIPIIGFCILLYIFYKKINDKKIIIH